MGAGMLEPYSFPVASPSMYVPAIKVSSALTLAQTHLAHAQTISAPQANAFAERFVGGKDVGMSTRPTNLNPFGINFADCMQDMVLQFSVTLSGFTADNPLRRLGDINFYVASDRYGFVEIGHLTICHAILDFICGLRVPEGMMPTDATAA